ncbi:MAG: hypothetical protein AB7K71_39805, partial [Polyangiaceae bacterium]
MRPVCLEEFVAEPPGTWVGFDTSLVWCDSPQLAGAVVWGSPTAEQAQRVLSAFHALWSPHMARQVDIVLDAREIAVVDGAALERVVQWCRARLPQIRARVHKQIGVIGEGLVGFTLSGILPILGETHDFDVLRDPAEALRVVAGPRGDALWTEVAELVAGLRGASATLHSLRAALAR